MGRQRFDILKLAPVNKQIEKIRLATEQREWSAQVRILIYSLIYLSMYGPKQTFDDFSHDQDEKITQLTYDIMRIPESKGRPRGDLLARLDAEDLTKLGKSLTRAEAARFLVRESTFRERLGQRFGVKSFTRPLTFEAALKRVDRAVKRGGLVVVQGYRFGRNWNKA